jgi:hypothetical protein
LGEVSNFFSSVVGFERSAVLQFFRLAEIFSRFVDFHFKVSEKLSQVSGGFNDVKLIGIKNQTDEALNEKQRKLLLHRTERSKGRTGEGSDGGESFGQFG